MGSSSQYEIDVGDGPEEVPGLEETDTPSPVTEEDQNQSSSQGNGNVKFNGNGNENENENVHSSKRGHDSEEQETGVGSDNKTQNGGGSTESSTPRSSSGRLLIKTYHDATGGRSNNGVKRLKMIEDDEEAGTKEEQAEFINELIAFYKGRCMEFKPPKFYGEPLNCLKLWRAVVQLGGYDRVTTYKLWRQVGESFHPPKTCTTISWTFRIFYEKALLDYEKHKREIGEVEFPEVTIPDSTSVENEGNAYQTGSGRVRRDAAARAMQGWHAQRDFGLGEVGEPIIKDKSINSSQKREKNLKNIGTKQKKPSNLELVEHEIPDANKQSVSTVMDVGPPADWVKINVRESKDCFEVYALVPGLLREEVRVQSDPAGRLVITGQPEQLDNPWGITPFRKVVIFPMRIDPLHTSAVVSLHGRLFVRVPFDRSNI